MRTNRAVSGAVVLGIVTVWLAGCAAKIPAKPAVKPEHEWLFALGLAAFREGTPEGYERAADAFRRAASLSPEHCEYSLHLAEARLFFAEEQQLNLEDPSEAEGEARRVISSVEAQPCAIGFSSVLNRVRALLSTPDLTEVVPDSRMELQLLPRATNRDTLAILNAAIEADANDPMNWVVMWKLNPGDSRSPLLRANELAPDLPIVRYEMGKANLVLKHYDLARRDLERAIELSPRHFHSMIGLGEAMTLMDPDTAEPEPFYRRAAESAPKSVESRDVLGYYFDGIEELDRSIGEYSEVARLRPGFEPGQRDLGIVLYKAGRADEALQALQQAIRLAPRDDQAHYYLGSIAYGRGDFARAQSEAELAIRYNGRFAEAHCLFATAFQAQGRDDDALAEFDTAIRINRLYGDALIGRGNLHVRRVQFDEAMNDFTTAIQAYVVQATEAEVGATKAEKAGLVKKAQAQRTRADQLRKAAQGATDVRARVQAMAGK